jgi:hypothetical protein
MLKEIFGLVVFLQGVAAFSLWYFMGNKQEIIFPYRISGVDDPLSFLYYQVDMDTLVFIMYVGLPLTIVFILLPIFLILPVKKLCKYKKTSLFFFCLEVLVWSYHLFDLIHLSQSLVHCDNFIAGKSLGCFIR